MILYRLIDKDSARLMDAHRLHEILEAIVNAIEKNDELDAKFTVEEWHVVLGDNVDFCIGKLYRYLNFEDYKGDIKLRNTHVCNSLLDISKMILKIYK